MSLLLPLALLSVLTAGLGWILWRLLGRPEATRALTWLWCGLAGFAAGLLLLQALLYLDLPLRRTAPGLLLLAAAGLGGLGWELWRACPRVPRRRWAEAGWVLAAGALAMAGHSLSAVGVGPDRFLGHHQYDLVNYVTTAQFLADEKFSTDRDGIGLRPWLWQAVELKNDRITECVALGTAAVLARTDAQRAWPATSVFFTGLLALALTGLWRVTLRLVPWQAAGLAVTGTLTPVVAYLYLVSFFSQLTSLFLLPALIAICWPGALPRKVAAVLAAGLLGFFAGTYTEFWIIGAGTAGLLVCGWRAPWRQRLGAVALIVIGSVALTTGYAPQIPAVFGDRLQKLQSAVEHPGMLAGYVRYGLTWQGWGSNFLNLPAPWVQVLAGLITLGALLGAALQPSRRRRGWILALLTPAGLLFSLLVAASPQVYATFKLLAELSPLVLGLAATGWARAFSRLGRVPLRLAEAAIGILAGAMVADAMLTHRAAVQQARGNDAPFWQSFWAARDRTGKELRAVYLIASGDGLIGAWLAYFGREHDTYYALPVFSDRKIPSEAADCRKIPSRGDLVWLDLSRTGPVTGWESSPQLLVHGAREQFGGPSRRAYVVGTHLALTVRRVGGPGSRVRKMTLKFGLVLLPGGPACEVVIRGPTGVLEKVGIATRRLVQVPLSLPAGETTISLQVDSAGAPTADRDLLVLQALSLESAD